MASCSTEGIEESDDHEQKRPLPARLELARAMHANKVAPAPLHLAVEGRIPTRKLSWIASPTMKRIEVTRSISAGERGRIAMRVRSALIVVLLPLLQVVLYTCAPLASLSRAWQYIWMSTIASFGASGIVCAWGAVFYGWGRRQALLASGLFTAVFGLILHGTGRLNAAYLSDYPLVPTLVNLAAGGLSYPPFLALAALYRHRLCRTRERHGGEAERPPEPQPSSPGPLSPPGLSLSLPVSPPESIADGDSDKAHVVSFAGSSATDLLKPLSPGTESEAVSKAPSMRIAWREPGGVQEEEAVATRADAEAPAPRPSGKRRLSAETLTGAWTDADGPAAARRAYEQSFHTLRGSLASVLAQNSAITSFLGVFILQCSYAYLFSLLSENAPAQVALNLAFSGLMGLYTLFFLRVFRSFLHALLPAWHAHLLAVAWLLYSHKLLRLAMFFRASNPAVVAISVLTEVIVMMIPLAFGRSSGDVVRLFGRHSLRLLRLKAGVRLLERDQCEQEVHAVKYGSCSFLFIQAVSSAVASVHFIATTMLCRWGPNAALFPYHQDLYPSEDLNGILAAAAISAVAVLVALAAASLLLARAQAQRPALGRSMPSLAVALDEQQQMLKNALGHGWQVLEDFPFVLCGFFSGALMFTYVAILVSTGNVFSRAYPGAYLPQPS